MKKFQNLLSSGSGCKAKPRENPRILYVNFLRISKCCLTFICALLLERTSFFAYFVYFKGLLFFSKKAFVYVQERIFLFSNLPGTAILNSCDVL